MCIWRTLSDTYLQDYRRAFVMELCTLTQGDKNDNSVIAHCGITSPFLCNVYFYWKHLLAAIYFFWYAFFSVK